MADMQGSFEIDAKGVTRRVDLDARADMRRALAPAKAGDAAPLVEAVERYLGDRR